MITVIGMIQGIIIAHLTGVTTIITMVIVVITVAGTTTIAMATMVIIVDIITHISILISTMDIMETGGIILQLITHQTTIQQPSKHLLTAMLKHITIKATITPTIQLIHKLELRKEQIFLTTEKLAELKVQAMAARGVPLLEH